MHKRFVSKDRVAIRGLYIVSCNDAVSLVKVTLNNLVLFLRVLPNAFQ